MKSTEGVSREMIHETSHKGTRNDNSLFASLRLPLRLCVRLISTQRRKAGWPVRSLPGNRCGMV